MGRVGSPLGCGLRVSCCQAMTMAKRNMETRPIEQRTAAHRYTSKQHNDTHSHTHTDTHTHTQTHTHTHTHTRQMANTASCFTYTHTHTSNGKFGTIDFSV